VIRVVVDPGVFISALIGRQGGAPDLVARAFADDRSEVMASPLLVAELEHVLRRPKFSRYADARTRQEFVDRVRRHATIVADPADQSRETAKTTTSSRSPGTSASMRSSAVIATCWTQG
jgi:putative PIN family toxin of toxin-antitoxin system